MAGRGRGAGGAAAAAAPPPRRVLLTNDDGPGSPFVAPLRAALEARLGWRVFTCLPHAEWSYVGKSLTLRGFDARRVGPDEVVCEGSPASCVNAALYAPALGGAECDFVVSGPNIGHNAGRAAGGGGVLPVPGVREVGGRAGPAGGRHRSGDPGPAVGALAGGRGCTGGLAERSFQRERAPLAARFSARRALALDVGGP